MTEFVDAYALIIGVAAYDHVNSLPDAIYNDAKDLVSVVTDSLRCGYLPDHVKQLLDPTRGEIIDGLTWLSQVAKPSSTVLIFFSGHGGQISGKGNFLLAREFTLKNASKTGIHDTEFTKMLSLIRAERLVVILDACHSGGVGQPKDSESNLTIKAGLSEETYKLLGKGAGRVVIASCRPDEESLILSGMKNSLFTNYLLEALRGNGTSKTENVIRIFDVFDFVSTQVATRTNSQHPIFKTLLENNFPIALNLSNKSPRANASQPSKNKQPIIDTLKLRKVIVEGFNLEELDLLCADVEVALNKDKIDLAVGIELSGGSGREAKVQRLIAYLERRDLLSYLIDAVIMNRPNLSAELDNV